MFRENKCALENAEQKKLTMPVYGLLSFFWDHAGIAETL